MPTRRRWENWLGEWIIADVGHQADFGIAPSNSDKSSSLSVSPMPTPLGRFPECESRHLTSTITADPSRRAFMSNGSCFGGSHIASKKEIKEMLKLAAEKNVRPWVDQVLPMSEAGKAIQGVADNKVSTSG
jgi:hypothetical protein